MEEQGYEGQLTLHSPRARARPEIETVLRIGADGGEVQLVVHGCDDDCVFHVFSVRAAWSGVGDSSEHRHIIMQTK